MPNKITDKFRTDFMEQQQDYDSINQAIRLAKKNNVPEADIEDLIQTKQAYKEEYDSKVSKMLRLMQLNSNLVRLRGSWYGIRYTDNKGNLKLQIEPLNDSDITILKRDGRRERELTRLNLDDLLPGCIKEDEIEIYKQKVDSQARTLVSNITGEVLEGDTDDGGTMSVTVHAGIRYVQRVLGIGKNAESVASAYRSKNLKEVETAVLKGVESASLMWVGEDGITYSFDDNNIMYVVGRNSVVTLYEEDFGFTKEINRMIVIQQMKVLRASHEVLVTAQENHQVIAQDIAQELQEVEDTIALLEAQVKEQVDKKASILSNIAQSDSKLKVANRSFDREFNKLFKRWE